VEEGFTVTQGHTSKSVDFNGMLYFTMSCADTGVELWKSDGTEAGTQIVRDIIPGPDSSSPDFLTVLNDRLFFAADDGNHGRELWVVAPVLEQRAGTAEPWRLYK
jgi:ELWxxDGT repeat protein